MSSSHLVSFIDEFATTGPAEIDPGKVLAAPCELTDRRKKRGIRHLFAHLLVIMVCSVMAVTSLPRSVLVPRTQQHWSGFSSAWMPTPWTS